MKEGSMPRHRVRWPLAAFLGLGLLAPACAVDVPRLMKSDLALQGRLMTTIAKDSTMTSRMVDALLEGDLSEAVVNRVLENGAAAQQVMTTMANDRTRLQGILSLAVQDSSMRDHVLTLLKGMEMAGTR